MSKNLKKRTAYLSYIEETRKHYTILQKVASKATAKAIRLAKSKNLFITYQLGNSIVREYKNGDKVIIGVITEPFIEVEIEKKILLGKPITN